MKITEYTISYTTDKNTFGDVIYQIKTKKEALKQANQLLKEGAKNIWINLHVHDDIVGDIKVS